MYKVKFSTLSVDSVDSSRFNIDYKVIIRLAVSVRLFKCDAHFKTIFCLISVQF